MAVLLAAVYAYPGRPWVDQIAVDGLSGTHNSLAYKVHEIEKHFHNREQWFGKSAGDTYYDPASFTEWQVAAGESEAYGTAVQISNGDEIESGSATKYYDMHKVLVTAVSAANKVYKLQVLYGTGVVGDATIATEIVGFFPATGKSDSINFMMPRITCNNKVWVKAACETDGATLDFIVGLHVYPGN